MTIRIFGEHDAATVRQLESCVAAEEGAAGVLCADGHVGYSMPIGGVVAYRDLLSPSGVGFDIACLAAGTPVTTMDGFTLPIERIAAGDPVACWDGRSVRRADPCHGAVARGRRDVERVTLANGRALVATGDHRVRTKLGWSRVDALRAGDAVACSAFVGLPFSPPGRGELALELPAAPSRGRLVDRQAQLRERALWPLAASDPRFPALLRLTGYAAGDGHLSGDGKRLTLYATADEDAAALRRDVAQLGFTPLMHARGRGPRGRTAHAVHVDSACLHALLRALGLPAGAEVGAWPADPFPWLFGLPAWMRALFLSAFASARAATPDRCNGSIAAPALEQAAATGHGTAFLARLLGSLGFRAGAGAPARDTVANGAVQVLGGERERLRFFEEVGFCRAAEKRAAAARVASVVAPDHGAEIAWTELIAVEPCGEADVFDIVTGDRAESFVAAGTVVHNCGNKAVRTALRYEDVAGDVPRIMDEVFARISFGVGRRDGRAADHPVIDEVRAAAFEPQRELAGLAAAQLGTVGAGNHYVDLFRDEADDRIWVGVHFGSRGFGHKTASGFLALAAGERFGARASEGSMMSAPVVFRAGSALGESYAEAMALAGRYAYAGRDVVVGEVLRILGTSSDLDVHNHHNFAWREEVAGAPAWVVRKGATPAFPGQRGFVGATMGEPAVILEGVASEESRAALYSTVHGAGRAMSRTQAAGKLGVRIECPVRGCDFWVAREAMTPGTRCPRHPGARLLKRRGRIRPGAIDFATVRAELATKGIELRGGAADEAPGAYKRLDEVLAHHAGTVRVLHRLIPIGVAMAPAETFDPYKD